MNFIVFLNGMQKFPYSVCGLYPLWVLSPSNELEEVMNYPGKAFANFGRWSY